MGYHQCWLGTCWVDILCCRLSLQYLWFPTPTTWLDVSGWEGKLILNSSTNTALLHCPQCPQRCWLGIADCFVFLIVMGLLYILSLFYHVIVPVVSTYFWSCCVYFLLTIFFTCFWVNHCACGRSLVQSLSDQHGITI